MEIKGVRYFDNTDCIIRHWYIPLWMVATKCKKCKLYPTLINVPERLCDNCIKSLYHE